MRKVVVEGFIFDSAMSDLLGCGSQLRVFDNPGDKAIVGPRDPVTVTIRRRSVEPAGGEGKRV